MADDRKTFMVEEYHIARRLIEDHFKRRDEASRYAVLASAVLAAWLTQNSSILPRWAYIVPFFIVLAFFFKGMAANRGIFIASRFCKSVEGQFDLDETSGLQSFWDHKTKGTISPLINTPDILVWIILFALSLLFFLLNYYPELIRHFIQ